MGQKNYGNMKEETKRKISETLLGRKQSIQTKHKRNETMQKIRQQENFKVKQKDIKNNMEECIKTLPGIRLW